MWAQVLVAPGRFELRQAAAPSAADVGDGEVLIRTLAGGICGSDLPYFLGGRQLPWPGVVVYDRIDIPGYPLHEIVGEVVASRFPGIEAGRLVVGWISRFNGLAEYVIGTGDELQYYDPSLPSHVAVMLQPLACVLYAFERMPPVRDLDVAVIGQGPIGTLFSHVAKAMGARRVTGIDRVDRPAESAVFGVDDFVRQSSDRWAADLDDDLRPQLVIEAVGHQMSTVQHAVHAVGRSGYVFCFGVPDDPTYPFPMAEFVRKDLTMSAGATRERRRMLSAADAYLRAHPALRQVYVTDVFAAVDAQGAYEMAVQRAAGHLKVVVSMESP